MKNRVPCRFFRSVLIVLSIGLAVSVPLSCAYDAGLTEPKIRVILESGSASSVTARVFMEDGAGQAVTGANGVVVNSSGVSKRLDFQYDTYCYQGIIPISSDRKYLIEVQSLLLAEKFSGVFEHLCLVQKPAVIVLRDQMGNDSLVGGTLSISSPMEVAWNAVEGATIYRLAISKSGTEIYASSMVGTTAVLPAAMYLGAGSYVLKVSAQFIAGDPLLSTEDYYSFSEKSGDAILFYVE